MRLEFQFFGRTVEFSTKALQLHPLSSTSNGGSWWPVIRESFTGAWQQNVTLDAATVLAYYAVFACQTLISSDIAKCCLRLVQEDADGIWTPTESAAFSPVLRKPNHFQTTQQFIETWVLSLLTRGNAYILKQRDERRVVVRLYVLDPSRVKPLVTVDGAVYYELRRDDMSGLPEETVTVPASEIIHDRMNTLFHPLVGLSPIYACGLAAMQGLSIQSNSQKFFTNGSMPGAIITAPQGITPEQAATLKTNWETNFSGNNYGKVAVLGGDLKFNGLTMNAVDAQLIEQLKWTGVDVCACHHVPPYLIDIGDPPPYANIDPVIQKYFNQCLQARFLGIENGLDEGLGLTKRINGVQLGTEFDINDLIWMDQAARNKAASDGIGSGGMSPDEARKRFFQLGKVPGGDTPYLQQQYFSLAALAKRDAADPFSKPEPAPAAPAADANAADDEELMAASFASALRRKSLERWRRAA